MDLIKGKDIILLGHKTDLTFLNCLVVTCNNHNLDKGSVVFTSNPLTTYEQIVKNRYTHIKHVFATAQVKLRHKNCYYGLGIKLEYASGYRFHAFTGLIACKKLFQLGANSITVYGMDNYSHNTKTRIGSHDIIASAYAWIELYKNNNLTLPEKMLRSLKKQISGE
jgi:hypothetical protein